MSEDKNANERVPGINGNMSSREAARSSLSDNTTQQSKPAASSATARPQLREKSSASRITFDANSQSNGASPHTSRNTSPQRKDARQSGLSVAQTPSQPSAAAIQRALSASNVPQLANSATTSTTDANGRIARIQKPSGSTASTGSAQWLASPRIKSPSPAGSRRVSTHSNSSSKKSDLPTPPSINVEAANSVDVSNGPQTAPLPKNIGSEPQLQTPTSKLAGRGPSGKSVLATVEEDGADAAGEAISAAVQANPDIKPLTKVIDEEGKLVSDPDPIGPKGGESGSESGGNKSDGKHDRRASITSITQPIRRSKNSFTSLAGSKVRQTDLPHNMTVETETVQSIPHSGLNLATDRSKNDRLDSGHNFVKVKSSTETIRPKKERRTASKKTRSVVNQGTASSKADIFEARVASAVDEANSSDSDETYVYESNPPESRRPRHHSRTPSVTSAHSTVEQRSAGIRNVGEVFDDRKIAGKRSMKFSNNPFTGSDSPTERADGTVRSHQSRHYGRLGRNANGGSVFEPDSPYTQASRLRTNPHSLRHSRPTSPRSPQTAQFRSATATPLFGKRQDSTFDLDADDERTPMLGTVRTPRSLRDPIRLDDDDDVSDPSLDEYYRSRRRRRCGTLGGCLLGVLIFAIVVLSTVGFLVISNRPLRDIYVRRIENVLASEQELMLDLRVGAVNPNALNVEVSDMDINIFAKSKYLTPPHDDDSIAGRRATHVRSHLASEPASLGLVTSMIEPSKGHDDLDSDSQTMLLGRIYHFDQALDFSGSPIRYRMLYSVGELRLAHPGNKTESGGSSRWNKVLHHPFELIVRGVLKYKLPVSAREESAAISASVVVHPEDGIDSMGRMHLEPVDHKDHWQFDWDHEKDMVDAVGEIHFIDEE